MPTDMDPIVDNWYLQEDTEQVFRVVALDDYGDSVEMQYLNGDVDEIDLESWYQLNLEPAEPPEDWIIAMDAEDESETDYDSTNITEDWPPSEFKDMDAIDEDDDDDSGSNDDETFDESEAE